jgi:putative hydrolase of the HAD superfamily
VVSNWDAGLPEVLCRAGLGGFDAVLASAAEGVAKPDPELFRRALRRLGVATGAVHVGDRWREDVEGAGAAGVRAVLLARDGSSLPASADVPVITSLEGLLELVP